MTKSMVWKDDWLTKLVQKATKILDAGSGPQGGVWWKSKPLETYMLAVDLYYRPPQLPPNSEFFMGDVASFCETSDKHAGFFDLIVADHILEHVENPSRFAFSFNRVLTMNGLIHIGVPDATMFTDRFYRLIHPDSGGHVSQLTLDSLTEIMSKAGFERIDYRPWPDDWQWLKRCYDWKGRGIQFITQADIDYIAETFLKELTPERGYNYGWEFIFAKRKEEAKYSTAPIVKPTEITVDSSPADASSEPLLSSTQVVNQFTPLEADQLHWLVYWILRVKQKRIYQLVKVLMKKFI